MEQLGVKNDVAKLQQLLGSKLYSNKYSFISEVLQNSTDAMRKCGKQDESFEVGIKQKDYKLIFYTRDTGCSFDSIEKFKELMNLLESSKSQTKDDSENQELGKFGIGSIAVSAYVKTWDYKIYKNGKGFDANLKEIDGKGLFIKCSDYYNTEEVDGVYFEIEINTNLKAFYTALIEKAKYFQNIRFIFDEYVINNLEDYYYPTKGDLLFINEKFKIYKSDDFQYSTLNKNENLHICVDQYTYNINWEELKIAPIKLPLALRFNLNDFDINPTREVLSIDENYATKIKEKIEKVANWLIDKYNEQNPIIECNNLKIYQDELEKRENKTVLIGEIDIDIFEFCTEHTTKLFNLPTFKDITPDILRSFISFLKQYWTSFYTINSLITNRSRKKINFGYYSQKNIFFIEKSIKKVYQDWFKSQNDKFYFYTLGKNFDFIKTEDNKSSVHFKSYVEYINKNVIEDEDFLKEESYRKQFNHFTFLKKEFEEHIFQKIEDVVPLEFINAKPKVVKVKKEKLLKSEEEIFLKYPRKPQKSISWYAVWEDRAIKVCELYKQPKLHIYGTEKNRNSLESLFTNFQSNKNNLQLIMVNDKTEKLIKEENPQNFVNIEDLKNKFGILNNYITASYIKHNLKGYFVLLNNSEIIKQYISLSIGLDIDNINKILKENDVDDIFYDIERGKSSEILKNIVSFYEENPQLYNQEYLFLYNKIEKVLKKLDFIELFITDIKNKSIRLELCLKTMRDLCRMKQIRMNWENYTLDKIDAYFKPIEEIIPELELVENE